MNLSARQDAPRPRKDSSAVSLASNDLPIIFSLPPATGTGHFFFFREQGHTATTRQIAEVAGISEAVLYQRFGSKDELFFAAMHPRGPDIECLLGPTNPAEDALAYLHAVVVRLGEHFADVIPLGLRVMMHPSFDPASLARVQPGGPAALREGLAQRLAALARRKELAMPSAAVTARLLISLAHDWALRRVHDTSPRGVRELKEMVDVVWEGLRARRR